MAVINGTAASETLSGTAAADTITGAGGNDRALMGAGNDVFVWNPGDGNDTVEGGTGNDTLRFKGENVHETFFILAGLGGHVVFDRTILGNDTLDLNDVERIEFRRWPALTSSKSTSAAPTSSRWRSICRMGRQALAMALWTRWEPLPPTAATRSR